MATGPTLLEVENLVVEYVTARGAVRAVDDVSFRVGQGEVFGLAGESGSGKSTIANAIMRILRPPAGIRSGSVNFEGADLANLSGHALEQFRWRKISMVFQSAMNSLNPVISIGDQIVDTIRAHESTSKIEAKERAAELLNMVGIDERRLNAYPHQLSGGMRQRAVIAIALALSPTLMIMDEPTTALDVVVQKEIMLQIEELKRKLGFSILFITHDLSLLAEFSDRIAIMYAGQIVEQSDAKTIFTRPEHPYTQGLMNSFPSLTGPKRRLAGIPGSPPDMTRPPTGCRFHPRCPLAKPSHAVIVPDLREISTGHYVACHLFDRTEYA